MSRKLSRCFELPAFVTSFLSAGLVLLASSCGSSATSTDESNENNLDPAKASKPELTGGPVEQPPSQPVEASARPKSTGPGQDPPASGQDSVRDQQRRFLIDDNLKRARRARELNLWPDVRTAALAVLELEENEEARKLLVEAEALLGDRQPTVLDNVRRGHIQAEVEKQRDLLRAREFETQGDALREKQAYEESAQAYERARLTLQYSPWFIPGGSEQARIEAKIKQVQDEHRVWLRTRSEEQAREARARLAAEEREERERLQRRVSELFIQANLAFQNRQYARTVTLLDECLKLEPLRQDASDLRELAMRARHDQNMDQLQREWRRQWAITFQDLRQQDVTQTDPIQHDIDYWTRNVADRRPIEFSHFEVVEDPDTAEILKTLERTSIDHKFAETPLADWVEYYRRATDVTFLVSPKVRELDENETTLRGFSIGKKSVRAALDLIARIKPIRWRVKDGVVHILTKDEGKDTTVPRVYDVREIINPLAQHPGRDIQLSIGDEGDTEPEAEEPAPVVVDIDKLQELIRSTVAKDSWDGTEGVSIAVQGPSLIISHTAEVHAQIEKLLTDLRGQSGIQVDIESRFLRVEDNFLEEIGVDFRGLGDQASEGVPGRGLEKQGNRAGFGFDDFGRNTSSSDPSVIGSGFEPGFFYDDGGDGDIFGRTEHLFDRVLGGGAEGLNNAGGMSFQWTYLDDAELEVILRAVEKQERVEQISAPRLLVHNTARAHLAVNRQFSYVRDFNVEIAQAAAVADPVVGVVKDGVVLDVRPVVAADRKYILLELRPTVATLALPIPTFTTSLGVGQPVAIQLPRLTLQKVRTTIVMPDGGTLLLGGMKNVQNQEIDSKVPFLSDLPGLSFFFSRKGTYRANRKILILLRAMVVVPQEYEPVIDTR